MNVVDVVKLKPVFVAPFGVCGLRVFCQPAKWVLKHKNNLQKGMLLLNVKMFCSVCGRKETLTLNEGVIVNLEIWSVVMSNHIRKSSGFIL